MRILKKIKEDSLLRYYDVSKPVTLQTDASKTAVGATLIQEGHPIAFASKALTRSQQNYHQIKLECLALLFGVTRFYEYVYGADLTVETDHKPLESIFKKPLSSCPARLQSMRLRIQDYSPKVVYIPGDDMTYADLLSRDLQDLEVLDIDVRNEVATSQLVLTESVEQLIDSAYKKRPEMKLLREVVKTGWPDKIKQIDKSIQMYWPYRDELGIGGKYLCKGTRVIIPEDKQTIETMLKRLHYGHIGINRTMSLAKDSMFWPGITKDITDMISKCKACQSESNNNQ